MINKLEFKSIEDKVLRERRACNIGEEAPIGSKIFNVIENGYNTLILLYPLKSEKIAGFTRKHNNTIQIFINTNLPRSEQFFAAAHELSHLLDIKEDKDNNFILCNEDFIIELAEENQLNIEESKANYFAAAFLLPKNVIEKKFIGIDFKSYPNEDLMLDILKLQYEYEVSYKAILKRLRELRFIGSSKYEMLKEKESQINDYIKMFDEEIQRKIKELQISDSRRYHTLNVPKEAADLFRNS